MSFPSAQRPSQNLGRVAPLSESVKSRLDNPTLQSFRGTRRYTPVAPQATESSRSPAEHHISAPSSEIPQASAAALSRLLLRPLALVLFRRPLLAPVPARLPSGS